MTKDEMRFIRRQLINEFMTANKLTYVFPLWTLKAYVRQEEALAFGYELKVYAE